METGARIWRVASDASAGQAVCRVSTSSSERAYPMRVVLEFLTGVRCGQKIVVPPGRSVSVGRMSWAELVCDDDPRMSKVHFHLQCDPYGCYLQDHQSKHGTLVDGVRVEDCLLRDGNYIVAGDTRFQIHIEGDNPAIARSFHASSCIPADLPEDEPTKSPRALCVPFTVEQSETGLILCRGKVDKIAPGSLARLVAGKWPAHLILDLHRPGVSLPPQLGVPHYLFDWLDPPAARLVSPVVISPQGTEIWPPLVNESWGRDGLICLFSRLPADELLAHLRNLCRAKGPGGHLRQGMFGYCWPGVLATLLAHGPRDTIGRLMAGIQAVLVEFSDLPEIWQLFGDEQLPGVLGNFGFVETSSDGGAAPKTDFPDRHDPTGSSNP